MEYLWEFYSTISYHEPMDVWLDCLACDFQADWIWAEVKYMLVKILAAPCITLIVLDLHGEQTARRHCAVLHCLGQVSSQTKDVMAQKMCGRKFSNFYLS